MSDRTSPNSHEVITAVRALVDGWCDRRSLTPLRFILLGYPLASPLTDGWGLLLESLQNVRAFAKEDLTDQELNEIGRIIGAVDRLIT